ncbi:hypothetical protein ACVWYQ_004383 [Bradyrhizobium sp. USDA 3397]
MTRNILLDLDQAGLVRLRHSRFGVEPFDHLANQPRMAHA